MSPKSKNPVSALFSALAGAFRRSAPDHWFLTGAEAPYRGEKTAISDAWSQSSWIFAALRLISQPVAAAPLRFADAATGAAIDAPELGRFWSEAAIGGHEPLSLARLVEDTIALRGVAGGAFWILDDSWLLRTPSVRAPLLLASPAQMTPLWDGSDLAGWAWRGGRGRALSLCREQVIHLRLPNPGDPDSLDGVAPWMTARHSAEAARAASKFARRVMDQNGDRGAFLIAKHALTEAQKEMLRAEMAEKRRAADRGEYRDSVIGGDIEVVPNPVSAVSAQFAGQVAMTRDEIFTAYGVPPSMATVAASYSVGAASDWYRLITGPCSAEARAIGDAVARVSDYVLGWRDLAAEIAGRPSRGRAERRCAAAFDFSSHPVMAQVRTERVEQLDRLFRIGVPVATANEFLGLGLPAYDGWEQRWLPASFVPADPSPSGPHEEEAGASKGADLAAAVRQWSARSRATAEARQEARRAEQWRRVDATRQRDRERVRKIVTRHVMAARAETLANLKAEFPAAKNWRSEYQVRSGALDIVFDVSRWVGGLWTDLERALGGIFRAAAAQAAEEAAEIRPADAGDYDPMTEADPRVVEALRRRRNLIKGAGDDIHAEIVASLEEGIEAGETLEQLSARVRAAFAGVSRVRAETIARTETGAAYETARYWTFRDAGITQKGWLSGGDDGTTRATHMAADGQARGIDEFFEVGEARLLHPHDQIHGAGHPGELINCRCVLTALG